MKAYLEHLISPEVAQYVKLRNDVIDRAGRKIAIKGQAFDRSCLELLLKTGLDDEDIVAVLELELVMDEVELYNCIQGYFYSDPSLSALFIRFNRQEQIQASCEYLCRFSSIMQKLMVMYLIARPLFNESIFCAWFGATILGYSKRSDDEVHYAFLAGMTHDIGFMHIDPAILHNTGNIDLSQWNEIRQHPLLSANILRRTRGFPEAARKAVEEHHEYMDGSGYPHCKVGDDISRVGQTIALLDTVHAIFAKYFKPLNRPIADTIPIIQMNTNTRFGNLGKIIVMMLKILPHPDRPALPEEVVPDLVKAVQSRNDYITASLKLLKEIHTTLGFRHGDPRIQGIQNAVIHVTVAVSESGIINDSYMTWLDQVRDEKIVDSYREIEDVYVMVREVIYHLEKLKQNFELFLETQPTAAYKDVIEYGLIEFDKLPFPVTPDSIKPYI